MSIAAYFSSLNLLKLAKNLPGGIAQGIIWGIMALGVYITFRLLDVADLTVDGSFTTGGAVTVMLILGGWPAWAALLVAMLAGLLAGMVTRPAAHQAGHPRHPRRYPDAVCALLDQPAHHGHGGQQGRERGQVPPAALLPPYPRRDPDRGLIIALVLVSVFYWYFGTEQGSAIRATGNNPAMSRALGINIDNMKVLGLSLSNGIVALSGGLMSQFQGFADINMGRGAIVIGLAAVIIGEVIGRALLGKRLNFYGTLTFTAIGGVIYYLVIVIVLWLKLNSNDLKLFTAVVVALFLAVPYLRAQRRAPLPSCAERGTDACWICKASARPSTPAPSTRKRPSTSSPSTWIPAISSPSSAATAPANPPCSTPSPASGRWTRAASSSTGRTSPPCPSTSAPASSAACSRTP